MRAFIRLVPGSVTWAVLRRLPASWSAWLLRQTMRALYETYNREGTEAILLFVDPAVEWSDPPESLDGGRERGHDGVRRGLARWTREWDEYRIEPVEFLNAGIERVLVRCRQRGRGKGSALVVESDLFMVWTLDNIKAIEMRMFFDRDQALQALRPE
jgi:ketosteroid isomerase-like protein